MAIFSNFKNQSQRFMTIFRNFKNQLQRFITIFGNVINQGITNRSKIKTLRYFRLRSSTLESKTQHIIKMNKRRIKFVTKILDEVKDQFPETKEFIDEHQEQGCSKENISMEEVIFLFTCLHAKIQHRKTFFIFVLLGFKTETFSQHLTKYVKRYSMKLNSLGHEIYLRVIWIQFNKSFLRFFFTDKVDLENGFAKMLVIQYFYNPQSCIEGRVLRSTEQHFCL